MAETFTRSADWQALLDSHVRAHEAVPFAWRGRNCTTFAADWAALATGRVLAVPGTDDARQAIRTVAGLGGLRLEACAQLGESVPGAFARCGDIVLLRLPRCRGRVSLAFGVCLGHVVAAQGHAGLVMVPITEAEAAWRV